MFPNAQFTLMFQWVFSANLALLKNITEGHINETFDLLGPVPRLCIEFTSEELDEYKAELDTALSSIRLDEIEKLIIDSSALSMNAVSHKICLLSGMTFIVEPLWLQSLLPFSRDLQLVSGTKIETNRSAFISISRGCLI